MGILFAVAFVSLLAYLMDLAARHGKPIPWYAHATPFAFWLVCLLFGVANTIHLGERIAREPRVTWEEILKEPMPGHETILFQGTVGGGTGDEWVYKSNEALPPMELPIHVPGGVAILHSPEIWGVPAGHGYAGIRNGSTVLVEAIRYEYQSGQSYFTEGFVWARGLESYRKEIGLFRWLDALSALAALLAIFYFAFRAWKRPSLETTPEPPKEPSA